MFELADPFTESVIRQNIIDVINTFEPRVELLDAQVTYDEGNNSVDVRIDFKILNTFTPITLDLVLERTR
jgi:predicted component of type VI protein secretion system